MYQVVQRTNPVGLSKCMMGADCTPDEAWLVTDASEPVRTRNPSASAGDERNAISTAAPGPGSFELLYVFPSPDAFEGQQVEAKGFSIRGDQDAINVTSIDGLGTRCVP